MSSVGSTYEDASKIAYLATRTFQNDLFSYTPTYNDSTQVRSGILAAPISGATSVTCPVGRFLYETGKKLIPGAHPGVKTLMIGVFDPVSFLSGFIDPNSEVFTRMNEDKSAMLDTITTAGTLDFGVFGRNPNGNTSDLADPVYTRGDVTALGQATITSDITSLTGDIVAAAGDVTANADVTATTGDITALAGDITANAGAITAAKQITSTAQVINLTSDTVDQNINITTYPSQNINFNWTHSTALSGCTIGFTAVGAAGDVKNVIIYNVSGGNLVFDGVAGSNTKYFSGFAATIANTNTLYLHFISNGTFWLCVQASIIL